MKILFLGDIMGRSGRRALSENLEGLRASTGAELIVVNGENASSGMGLSAGHASAMFAAGADVVTLGDHAFDQKDMLTHIETETRLVRPLNYAKSAPGRGATIVKTRSGKRVLVAQILGQVFMKRAFDDPFSAMDGLLNTHRLGGSVDAILVDVHAEATSEKMAMGHFLDGRVSLVVGTHTHVPTADAQILPRGTAYQTDAGMCGDYNSVIGMDKDEPLRRFVTGMGKSRFEPARGEATLCGVLVELDPMTGLARNVSALRVGGRLQASAALC